ncbi:hypothetical protein AVEN_49275-1, partial [Araneus ventricosus]
PRWLSGKVSALRPEDSRLQTRFHRTSAVDVSLLDVKSYLGGRRSPRWCSAEVPVQASSSSSDHD